LILFFQRRLPIVEQNNITTGTPHDCAEKIINLSEVIIRKQNAKIFALHKLKDIEGTASTLVKDRSRICK
jgi:Fe(3+) dicitrate transport protein